MYKEYNKENLGDEKFFKYFKEISNIPRKSSNEGKIADYLVKFAKYRGLQFYRDSLNNVIIWKKASKGYENKPVLGLQNHIDMVCEKTNEVKHDFSRDKLQLYIDGDFVKAKGTTLGADNGVGVAYVLAILDSDKIESPELECIFTVQEETTMDGARLLDVSKLKSKRIISFDSFYEDIMVINSASCKEWSSCIKVEREKINKNEFSFYKLILNNFKGGHSGLDIADKKRGNPIKIAFELLSEFDSILINNLNGGSRLSIIPREIKIDFCIKKTEEYKLKTNYTKIDKLKKYFQSGEEIILNETKGYDYYITNKYTKDIINFINEFENGALEFDESGQVILSANMGVVEIVDDNVVFRYSLRSNERKLGNKKTEDIKRLMKKYSISVIEYDEMKPFEHCGESKLVESCSKIYYNIFNQYVKKIKSQTCLEIGFLAERIENLEYIAIAPNIYNAHSPDEKFSISSSKKMWRFIKNLLKDI